MIKRNPTQVIAQPVKERTIGIFYPFTGAKIGLYSVCNIRNHIIEAQLAKEICEAYEKYLKSVQNGIILKAKTNPDIQKNVKCVPLKKGMCEIRLRKSNSLIIRYSHHAKGVYMQNAQLDYDIMKAIEQYLKRMNAYIKAERDKI